MSIIFKKTCLYVGILPGGAGAQVNASVHMKDGEGAQSEECILAQVLRALRRVKMLCNTGEEAIVTKGIWLHPGD